MSRSSYEELFGYNDLSDKNREFLMSSCKVDILGDNFLALHLEGSF